MVPLAFRMPGRAPRRPCTQLLKLSARVPLAPRPACPLRPAPAPQETFRLVMTQFLLTGCDMHPMQSLKYIAPAATGTLLIGSYFKEYPEMLKHNSLATPLRYPFHFALAACMGLVVNVLGVIIIKLSSATTAKVLAAVRGPIVVFCGILLFAEHVSTIEFVGYSVALVGFVWYNYAKAMAPAIKPSIPKH